MRIKSVLAVASLSLTMLLHQNCGLKDSQSSSSQKQSGPCRAPQGLSSPSTIAGAVALINALPKPVSVHCFLESLEGPLQIYATSSTSSAQPAFSTTSPRIFLFSGNLIISIVPEGTDSDIVEFSELKTQTRSLKGELLFPIVRTILTSAPFDRIRLSNGTSCGTCHSGESRDMSISYAIAFESNTIRPFSGFRVAPSILVGEAATCDSNTEPKRCAILSSIFNGRNLIENNFGQ